jgi:ABC-type proline/glycine betaine transport system permease subunit
VVLLAIVLDRITQSFGELRRDGAWKRLLRWLRSHSGAAEAS